jgi:hypothetical protein
MAKRYPIEYQMSPRSVEAGVHWLTLKLKNLGAEDLTNLEVRLNSLDTQSLNIFGSGSYLSTLRAGEEKEVFFQASAHATGSAYVTLDGRKKDKPWHWESPAIPVTVGEDVAELVSLFALTKPYPILGEKITCEAVVRGLAPSRNLVLEFWVQTPSGEFRSPAKEGIGFLAAGEEIRRAFDITPDEEGVYILHAYLYDGTRRIGHQVDHLSMTI